jgi:hypothetical protein
MIQAMESRFGGRQHCIPVQELAALPDPRYHPPAGLRLGGELDWPVVPLLNALVAIGETPDASCARGEVTLLGFDRHTLRVARALLGATGGGVLSIVASGEDERCHLRLGGFAERPALRPAEWLDLAERMGELTRSGRGPSPEGRLIARLRAVAAGSEGFPLPADVPHVTASHRLFTRRRVITRVTRVSLCCHLNCARCVVPATAQEPFRDRPVHLRLSCDGALGEGLVVWGCGGAGLREVDRISRRTFAPVLPSRGLGV